MPVYNVPSAIAADCSRPVDVEIGAWLATVPDASTAVFAAAGCYGLDESIFIDDRHGITIDGNGSTFKTLTRGQVTRANWRIRGGADITIHSAIIRGAGTAVPRGQPGNGQEVQHGVSFDGTRRGTLRDSQIYDIRGDFVEAQPDIRLGTDYSKLPPAHDITIRSVQMERADRQGIGFSNVDGAVVTANYIGDVSQTAIDIEIDAYGERSRNIEITNNRFGPVAFSVLANLPGRTPDNDNITFRDNTMEVASDSCLPPILVGDKGLVKTNYNISGNTLLTLGDGISLTGVVESTITNNTITYKGNGACNNLTFLPPLSVPVRRLDSDVYLANNVFEGFPMSGG